MKEAWKSPLFFCVVSLILCLQPRIVFGQSWNGSSSGIWGNNTNWTGGSYPNTRGATATLGAIATGNTVISLGGTRTLGTLNIQGSQNFTINSGGANRDLRFDVNAGTAAMNISGSTASQIDSSVRIVLYDNTAIAQNSSGTFTIASAITQSGGTKSLAFSGMGTTVLSGTASNTYTGTTTVDGGTVTLSKSTGARAITGSSVTINSGGTLLLGNSDQIGDTTNMTLAGGNFSTGTGFSETLGALTLTADSSITLGASIHNLQFGASNLVGWSPGATLTIYGWSASAGQILFGNSNASLTASQLAQISFDGYTGVQLLSNGELIPMAVPETRAILAAILLVGVVLWRERKTLQPLRRCACSQNS